jgi:hypothetical protein
MRYTTTLSLIAFSLLIAGCRPTSLYMIEPKGPSEYKLGWEDGCDSGVASISPAIYKMAFGFRKRPEFYSNQLYQTAWNEGFSFCRFSLGETGKDSPFN